ncbi:MAG: P-protein [Candidatus Dichloromethanomonas elyunquensis]|nr:MAG: P-protein [Candidatus Dichloromethanomonas elyunquensis]
MENLNHLEILRNKIDEIDSALLQLFEERMKKSLEIAEYKARHDLGVLDEVRERKVLEKAGQVEIPELYEYAKTFLTALMDISKDLQEKHMKPVNPEVIGFQGLPGSYSEQALRLFFGEAAKSRHYSNFEDVFKALQAEEIDYGVLPLENSYTGGISDVYDLLCHFGFYIIGEKCVQVDNNLLAVNGARLEDIREIYSHPQALLQCSRYLKSHPQWHTVSCSNTAVSAKLIADSGTLTKAAIASRRAAELYGLTILAEGINNNKDNFTRFIIIGREPKAKKENNKISMALAIAHEPGSLHRILSHFAKNELNMLKIESRPMTGKTWEYLFYIDFEGNLERKEIRQAVDEIKKDSTYFKLLGNYSSNYPSA